MEVGGIEEAEAAVVAEEGVATTIMAGETTIGTSSGSMEKQSTCILPINLIMINGTTYPKILGNNLSSYVGNIETVKGQGTTKMIMLTIQECLHRAPGRCPSHIPIMVRSGGLYINCPLHLWVVLRCLQRGIRTYPRQLGTVTIRMISVQ